MCPAPRKPENRDLPPGLHRHPRGYRYKRPDGSYVYLGYERLKAIEAAKLANLHFAPKTDLFDKIVSGDSKSLASFIDEYIRIRLPKYEVKEDTKKNREYILNRIKTSWLGTLNTEEISTRQLYDYLDSLSTDWIRQSYRAQLIQLFNWSIRRGLRENNPAMPLERPNPKRSRQRLSLDEFNAIRDHAPTWLQNFMDLALQTAQRPGDVALMCWEDVADGQLRIIQQKTGRKIALGIDGPLREVLDRCRDNIVSPFIVHRLPEKLRPRHMRAKQRTHHTQVLLEQAERAFDEARKASKLYNENSNPPTLHEIRSLSGSLYRLAGWPEERVQLLMGHTELKMTRHYLKGQEAPWEQVLAGLQIATKR